MYLIIAGGVVLVVLLLIVLVGSKKQNKNGLQIGDTAPDFELKNFQGKSFRLSSYRGKQSVVVFFYPADNTPGCTAEVTATQFFISSRLFILISTSV